jgi:hypothetical protein
MEGVGVCVDVGVGVFVGVGVDVSEGVGVGVDVSEGVGVLVGVGVAVFEGVGVSEGVGVLVGVDVDVSEGVGEFDGVPLLDGVIDGVGEFEPVAVPVDVFVPTRRRGPKASWEAKAAADDDDDEAEGEGGAGAVGRAEAYDDDAAAAAAAAGAAAAGGAGTHDGSTHRLVGAKRAAPAAVGDGETVGANTSLVVGELGTARRTRRRTRRATLHTRVGGAPRLRWRETSMAARPGATGLARCTHASRARRRELQRMRNLSCRIRVLVGRTTTRAQRSVRQGCILHNADHALKRRLEGLVHKQMRSSA